MWLTFLLLACTGPEDSGEVEETSGSFTVLTYNVHGLPPAVSDHPTPADERLPQIGPRLGPYDLVGLQEDFDDTNHAALVASVDYPIQERFTDKVEEGRVYGAGLTLMSRVGREDGYEEEHYTECVGFVDSASDCLASKGFQVLTLNLGGALVDVYNTHHEAGGGEDDNAARMSQVQQVLASIEGRSAGRAILYMGDFNLRPSDPEDEAAIAAYEDAGLRLSCAEVSCDEPDHIDKIYTRNSDALTLTVDAWANVSADFLDEDGIDLSDHPPITATLSWSVE